MTTVEEAQAALPTSGSDAVKARGYWELIWIRLRRDKLAIAGGVFIILMFFVAFIGAPIAAKLLGHGPNEQFFDAVDPDTFLPVGPMTKVKTPDGGTTLFILGADSTIGRDLFLRLLYGARTSLEVAVFATFFSVSVGVLFGALGAFVGMLALNQLPRLHHSLFSSERFSRATDDKFFISIESGDPRYDEAATRSLLESLHADAVERVEAA